MRAIIGTLWIFLGCTVSAATINAPRLRPSPYFGAISGMSYSTVEDLGRHDYNSFFGENNAMVYTAKGGYIDMGHLREAADRARYIFEVCQENLRQGKTDFSYEIIEPAIYHVSVEYPAGWDMLSDFDKDRIIREVAIDLGQHYAQISNIWHEIVTWYGYASTGLMSEKASSFSWEDGYSDLLGSKIGAMVLRQNTDYNTGMTEMIAQELNKLDPQSVETAKKATETIKGKWFSGRYPFLSMKRRNFDVGFDDGYISPFRVPGICPNAPEVPCRRPPLDSLEQYGFTIRLTLTPKESERHEVLAILYPAGNGKTLIPDEDFPVIIEHIRDEAIRESGANVDKPIL